MTATLDGTAIKDRSITEIKLSDYSIACIVQEDQPSVDFKLGSIRGITPSTSTGGCMA